MTRRLPRVLPVLWALAALLLVLAAVLFAYGRLGGTTPTSAQPYRWDGQADLVINHRGKLTGEQRTSWCEVQPDHGDSRRFTGRRYRAGELRVQTEPAWFDGAATVTCQRGAVLDGPLAPFVGQWTTAALLGVGVAVVSIPVHRRSRR